MSATLGQVLTTTRTYLNDDAASQFTDPVLIPKCQEAHRELQTELWAIGSPLVRASALMTYIAGQVRLDPGSGWPPSDLLCPYLLFENAAASTQVSPGWTPMTEAFYIPLGTAPGATLGFWAWQEEDVILAGSIANRAVVVQYRRQINIPVVLTDKIGILFGESFLAARTAAIAGGTIGGSNDLVARLNALAKENLSKVMAANRGQQRPLMNPGGNTGWPVEGGGRDK